MYPDEKPITEILKSAPKLPPRQMASSSDFQQRRTRMRADHVAFYRVPRAAFGTDQAKLQLLYTMITHVLTFIDEQRSIMNRYDKVPATSEVRSLDQGVDSLRKEAEGFLRTFAVIQSAMLKGNRQSFYVDDMIDVLTALKPSLLVMEQKLRSLWQCLDMFYDYEESKGNSDVHITRIALHKTIMRVKNAMRLKTSRGGFAIGTGEATKLPELK